MKVTKNNNAQIVASVFIDKNIIKTHNCDIREWWGGERCEEVNINDWINELNYPSGEYRIVLSIEQINHD